MARHSFEGSLIKQNRRNDVLGYFQALHPDRREAIRALTLPGVEAFPDPASLENQLLESYPHSRLTCLEAGSRSAYIIAGQLLHVLNPAYYKRVDISANYALRFLHHYDGPPFDLIFLDWMSELSSINQQSIELIFSKNLLTPRGLLATTIVAHERKGLTSETLGERSRSPQHLALLMNEHLHSLASAYDFKISEKSYSTPYSCMDRSMHAVPMILSVVMGLGKKSFNAYDE